MTHQYRKKRKETTIQTFNAMSGRQDSRNRNMKAAVCHFFNRFSKTVTILSERDNFAKV